jgi:hypothetical protein
MENEKELSEAELRKLAHERVWGQTGQQFVPLKSVLPEGAEMTAGPKPRGPESSKRGANQGARRGPAGSSPSQSQRIR